MNKAEHVIPRISLYLFYGLLIYAPLHIAVSTLIGANLGGLEFFKIAKDVALFFGFATLFLTSIKKTWFITWLKIGLVVSIGLYALLTLLLAAIRPTDRDAEILGIVYNLRFLVIFLYGRLLTKYFSSKSIRSTAINLVLVTGGIVITLGLIQYFALPDTALERVGFTRENGVLPAFFIDDKPDLERVMSTLRDPNSLGSYLIILLLLAAGRIVDTKRTDKKLWLAYGLGGILCMYLTFSRSAWLGFVCGAMVFLLLVFRKRVVLQRKQLKFAAGFAIALTIVGAGVLLYGARNTYFVQNVIFHADDSTVLEDPNELRLRFWRESATGIIEEPLGSGPGTAGLASIRNDTQGTQLNENYYLQVGAEIGIIGLVLFALIIAIIGTKLLQSGDIYAAALLGALVGLVITNFLVHIWSNEAVALTWWGLAGLFIVKKKS